MMKLTKGKIALFPIIIGITWFLIYGLFYAPEHSGAHDLSWVIMALLVIALIILWIFFIAINWNEEFSWLKRRR